MPVVGLLLLAFWLYCLFDVITTPDEHTRNLPKVLWVIIVVLLVDIGGVLWLLLGRPRRALAGGSPWGPARAETGPTPTTPAPQAPRGPDDDPDFLRDLERRLKGDTPD
ncbi:PLD nuclease N-terminal domain-containing protein [Bailinhaonella thermotolerans]|nr:PLD nuclease N-terminal domain-containing protein [Bailinhaonella thermotolerans]